MLAEIAGLTLFLVLFSALILGSQAAPTPKAGSSQQSMDSPAGNVVPQRENAKGPSSLAL